MTAEQCRRRAAECQEQAASNPEALRTYFLELAITWLKLAEELERPAVPPALKPTPSRKADKR
jgi:hypothetical protein